MDHAGVSHEVPVWILEDLDAIASRAGVPHDIPRCSSSKTAYRLGSAPLEAQMSSVKWLHAPGLPDRTAPWRSVVYGTPFAGCLKVHDFFLPFSQNGEPIMIPAGHPPASCFSDLYVGDGCDIQYSKDRGITLQQLQRVMAHIKLRCVQDQWWDSGLTSPTYGQPLDTSSINWHQVVHWIVLPATHERRCSYMELVAQDVQTTLWFVSHFWGQAIQNLVLCLARHSEDRGADAPYWISALAESQWDTRDSAGLHVKQVLESAEGTISVVDEEAEYFRRIWCGFEVWTSLLFPGAVERQLHDIYTTVNDSAVGILDGFAKSDLARGDAWAFHEKHKREKLFPAFSEQALSFSIQKAVASVEGDRQRILNSVVDADPQEDPPAYDLRYDQFNSVVRGRFAAATWRHALEARQPMDKHMAALSHSGSLRLTLSFADCGVLDDQGVHDLTTSLPECIRDLQLRFDSCTSLTDASVCSLSEALPASVRRLNLSFLNCSLTNEAISALALRLPPKLRGFKLCLARCRSLTDNAFQCLADHLPPQLEDLRLDVRFCEHLTTRGTACSMAGKLPRSLQNFVLQCWDTQIDAGRASHLIKLALAGCETKINIVGGKVEH